MLLSCKLSNTVLLYLETRGEDVTSLLESVSIPEEFLKDPSSWLTAREMETFLESAMRFTWQTNCENLLQEIAHSCVTLRSWGVLDSVLRIMPRPQEILAQPGRFLSHFISPEPPIENIKREESGLSFDLPISSLQYPLVTQFLKWSFETLPVYVGKESAVCDWTGIRLNICWNSQQKSMFEESDPVHHQISPDLLREIVASLEHHQHELQQRNSELQARNDQLLRTQQELEGRVIEQGSLKDSVPLPSVLTPIEGLQSETVERLRQNLSRMTDAFVRAQQLVTLLVAQGRQDPIVTEAMRRVDWDRVKTQFPKTMEESFAILEKNLNSRKEQSHV